MGETGYDYEFPGETHSGRDIRLVNSNALGFRDESTKKGAYVGYVGNRKWRLAGNIWSPATGVVLGVENYPAYDHPAGLADILLENNNGKFKEVTTERHLLLKEHTVSATVADLDNNGYEDLIVVPRGDLIHTNQLIVFANHGPAGFKRVIHHDLKTTDLGAIGMAIQKLDYNQDGKVDIVVGNERGKWHLFKNTLVNDSHSFITIDVGSAPSGQATALGALVEVKGCQNIQKKRVGSTGASYSLSFDNHLHFGLGDCSKPIKVKVTWSNQETLTESYTKLNEKYKMGL